MIKVVIENKQLVSGLKKVGNSLKDSLLIQVQLKKTAEGNNYATLMTSDGKTQTCVFFTCKTEIKESLSVIVGREFREVVNTLANCGDDFTLEVDEAVVMIECGASRVPVGIKGEFTTLQVEDPTKSKSVTLTVDTEEFAASLFKGGFAYTEKDGKNGALVNVIALIPVKTTDGYALRILSIDANGVMSAGSICGITIENSEAIDGVIANKRAFLVNASYLMKSINEMDAKTLSMFITGTQATIRNRNDIYIMTLKDSSSYPVQIADNLFGDINMEYSFEVDKKLLKAAAAVAILNGLDEREKNLAVLSLEESHLTVSSINNKNETKIAVTAAQGTIRLGVNVAYLRSILDHSADKVTICGINYNTPIFFKSEKESTTFLLPVNINDIEECTEEGSEETKED